MKKILTLAFLIIGLVGNAQQNFGELFGYTTDAKTGEEIIGAHCFIKDGDRIYQASSDVDGSFRISMIPAGTYTMYVKYDGDTIPVYPIDIKMDITTMLGKLKLDFAQAKELGPFVLTPGVRLIDGDLPVLQINYKELERSPAKFDPTSLIIGLTSEARLTADGDLVFRGGRKGDMLYIVDGVKNNQVVKVPSAAINNMMIYTGALPAKYGDTMGGVIVVETKSYFDLYRAWVNGR